MRILLTGASGFIGRRVLPLLAGHTVLCLDRSRMTDVEPFGAEVVIHLAWPGVYGDGRYAEDVQRKGWTLTCQLLAATKRTCTRWVATGSQAETSQPGTAYARYKTHSRLTAECMCKTGGVSFAWARLYSVYGPGAVVNSYLPYLIRELQAGHNPALTDQDIPWDFLYVDDAARAIVLLETIHSATGIFDIAYGEPISTQTAAKIVRDKINPSAVLRFGDRPRRDIEIDGLHPDVRRMNLLGWKPEVSFSDGVDAMIQATKGTL